MENLQSILITSGVSTGLLLATYSYLQQGKTKDVSLNFLGIFFLTGSLLLTFFSPLLRFSFVFICLRTFFWLMFVPSLYIYLKAVFISKNLSAFGVLKHTLPAFAAVMVLIIIYIQPLFFNTGTETSINLTSDTFGKSLIHRVNTAIGMGVFFQLFFYSLTIYITFPRYLQTLGNYYSNIAHFKPAWALWAIGITVSMYVLADLAILLQLIGADAYRNVFFLFILSLMMITGWYGLFELKNQTRDDKDVIDNLTLLDLSVETALPKDEPSAKTVGSDMLVAQLEQLMYEKALYLNTELNLRDVASMLSSNTHYLSRAINTSLGKNFNRYVNQKRVEKAIQLMQDSNKFSLWGIGQQSGFYTKSVYINAFKKETGYTPAEYLNQMKSKE